MALERIGLNRLKESARAALSLRTCLFSRPKYSQIKFGKTPTLKVSRSMKMKLNFHNLQMTSLFNADLASLERALKIIDDFGKIAGLSLNVKKTKAIWLGKWANNKNKPLNLKWLHSPVKILGIHFSYDEKRNNELNFMQKVQRKLDMWSARDLTIFAELWY